MKRIKDEVQPQQPQQPLQLEEEFSFKNCTQPEDMPYVTSIENFINAVTGMKTKNDSLRYILYYLLQRYRVLVTDRMDVFFDMITDDDCDSSDVEVAKEHLQMNKEEKESIDDMLFHLSDCEGSSEYYNQTRGRLSWFLEVIDKWRETPHPSNNTSLPE